VTSGAGATVLVRSSYEGRASRPIRIAALGEPTPEAGSQPRCAEYPVIPVTSQLLFPVARSNCYSKRMAAGLVIRRSSGSVTRITIRAIASPAPMMA
jgi:hypothetical protein